MHLNWLDVSKQGLVVINSMQGMPIFGEIRTHFQSD